MSKAVNIFSMGVRTSGKLPPAPRVDPGQLSFEFFEKAAAPPRTVTQSERPQPPREIRNLEKPAQVTETIQIAESNATTAQFMTESRAAEIFMAIATDFGHEAIKRARVAFKPFRSTLYSFKIHRGGTARIKLHVAFRRATEPVVRQASQIMLRRKRGDKRPLDRTEYSAFVRAIPSTDFELPGARKARQLAVSEPGRHYSLEESFARINAEYFKGQLAAPKLCWSPVRARRVLGSYHERSDRLIISRLFDSPKIPQYVLDYLMYHELLHKFLGIGKRNDGKRCMHGPEFREIEKKFRHYEQATQFLKKL